MIETHAFLWGRDRYLPALERREPNIATVHGDGENPGCWAIAESRGFECAVFCIDGAQPHGRTLWHLLRAAEGVAGFYRAALLPPGESFEAEWMGERRTYKAGLALHNLRGEEFDNGIAAAWVLRRPDLAKAIAGCWDVLTFAPMVGHGAAQSFNRALTQVVFGHEALCRQDLGQAIYQAVRADYELAPFYRENVLEPRARLVLAYLDRDEVAFNTALERCLVGQRVCYSRTDLDMRTPLGYVAWVALGLCALAHDAGMAVTVESAYIPAWLYRKEWERVPADPV